MNPTPPNRRFLGAGKPVAELVADAMIETATRLGRAADLTGTLAIVPTRTAARRLRIALAEQAAKAGLSGVLIPQILTPEALIRTCAPAARRLATDAARLVLARTLAEIGPESLPHLFPKPPASRDAKTFAPAAEAILRARSALGEAADTPDFATVAAHPENREPERWRDLAVVEARLRAALAKIGYTDADDARATAVRDPILPSGITGITLAAIPDPSPALLRLLRNAAKPVTVLIADDASRDDAFDEYGAPRATFWKNAPIPWHDFDRQVRLPESPAGLARDLAAVFSENKPDGRATAFIIADPTLTRTVEQAIADTGTLHNPAEGLPLDTHPHAILLRDWASLLREQSWESFSRLLRRPAFAKLIDPEAPHTVILADADKAEEQLLPHDLSPPRETAGEPRAITATRRRLAAADRLRREFNAAPFSEAVANLLAPLGPAGEPSDEDFSQAVAEHAADIQKLATALGGLDAGEQLAMLVRRLRESAHHPALGAEHPTLRGWLELLWEDAPHTLILGMNEGCVPETLTADPFLPGEFRHKLGLPDDDARLARDAYSLSRALRLRADGRGRLDLAAPRHDEAGEPLRPSRLLTLGVGEALPGRILRLHDEGSGPEAEPARTRAWRWKLRVDAGALRKIDAGMPPTAFKDYLACPLRFYLKRVVGAKPNDPDKAEPDAAAFGDLVHAALATFARDNSAAALTDETRIRQTLSEMLDAESRRRHGAAPALAALVQREAARARLSGFAAVQAALRADGWSTTLVEHPFRIELRTDDGAPFIIEGRFDRIDRHADGRLRVIDYKTADAGTPPDKDHLAPADKARSRPDYAYTANTDEAAKPKRWTNLQLPLYAEAARALPGARANSLPEIAYALLPASAADAALIVWPAYTLELHADALRCATGIAADIRARRFPSALKPPPYDDFADLLGDDAESAIDRETFERELARA